MSIAAPREPTVLRPRELTRIVGLVERGAGCITVTGLGGIGKTMLAQQVVERVRSVQPQLEPETIAVPPDDEALFGAILDAVDESGATADRAEPRPRLLLLDGGEAIRRPAELQRLLRERPGLQLLVTSRVPLGIAAESVVPLAGLDTSTVDGPAVTYFASIAEEVGVELPRSVFDAVRRIVERLGGHPLACGLAARSLAFASLDELEDRVRAAPTPTGEHEASVLVDAMTWALQRCSAPARQLAATMSVFEGRVSLDSIEGVFARASGLPHSAPQTMWLSELVDVGLVEASPSGLPSGTDPAGDDRPATSRLMFRMHDSVRGHVSATCGGSAQPIAELREVHRTWYLEQAEAIAASYGTRKESAADERLQTELTDHLHALYLSLPIEPLRVRAIASTLGEFWVARGHLHAGISVLQKALAGCGLGDAGLEAKALTPSQSMSAALAMSWVSHLKLRSGSSIALGEYRLALRQLLAPCERQPSAPTRELFTLALHDVFCAMIVGDLNTAQGIGTTWEAIAGGAGDDHHASLFALLVSRAAEAAGDEAAAIEHVHRALVHARRTQNDALVARCMSQDVMLRQGSLAPEELVRELRALIDRLERHGRTKDAVLISPTLVIAQILAGEWAAALSLLRRTLKASRRMGSFDSQIHCVALTALCAVSDSSPREVLEQCALLYGGVRPYIDRLRATASPKYVALLQASVAELTGLLGHRVLDRIAARAPRSWIEVTIMADQFLETLIASADAVPSTGQERDAVDALTERERDLLRLLLTGMPDKQIAQRLSLRPSTVRTYNSRLFAKLGVASRSELLVQFPARRTE